MIYTAEEHFEHVKKIKDTIFKDNFDIGHFSENHFIGIKDDADIFFTNLNKMNLYSPNQTFEPRDHFYKDVIYNQLLSQLDLSCHYKYLVDDVIQIQGEQYTGEPAIYCSFHYGAYMQIASALRILQKDFAVVTNSLGGNDIVKWDKTESQIQSNVDYFQDFEKINPFDKEAIFKMYLLLKKGTSVLVFIDGLQGGMATTSKRDKAINLLNTKISLSSGVTEISKKLEIPLIPVIAEREEQKINVTFYEPFDQIKYKDDTYAEVALQSIVDTLIIHLEKKPEQWQEWPHIHNKFILPSPQSPRQVSFWQAIKLYFKSLKEPKLTEQSILEINTEDFQQFRRDEQSYLINIKNYHCFKISENLKAILEKMNEVDLNVAQVKAFIKPNLFLDLIKNNILKVKKK